jgi:hypothetical protein
MMPDKLQSVTVECTVPCRGPTQAISQRVQVGLRYAGQIVTIEGDKTPCES